MVHKDVVIKPRSNNHGKSKVMKLEEVDYSGKWRAFFDGACRKGKAGGGFVVFNTNGDLVAGSALWFGAGSNNEAEAWACEALVERLVEVLPASTPVVIHGDSKLIIDFLTRAASPNKKTLLLAMRRSRKGVEGLPGGVHVVHIPRA